MATFSPERSARTAMIRSTICSQVPLQYTVTTSATAAVADRRQILRAVDGRAGRNQHADDHAFERRCSDFEPDRSA